MSLFNDPTNFIQQGRIFFDFINDYNWIFYSRLGIDLFVKLLGRKPLAVVPPKSTIEVALDAQGRGIVRGLFVDGVPVGEWLRKLGEERR